MTKGDKQDTDEVIRSQIRSEMEKERSQKESQMQNNRDSWLKQLSPTHATGETLVNIYFKSTEFDVCKTEIELYRDVHQKENKRQLLGSFKVNEGMFFQSIDSLAFGDYSYRILQYVDEDLAPLESDFYDFKLKPIPEFAKKPTFPGF